MRRQRTIYSSQKVRVSLDGMGQTDEVLSRHVVLISRK